MSCVKLRTLLAFCGGAFLISEANAKPKYNDQMYRITGTTLTTINVQTSPSGKKHKKTIGLLKVIPTQKFVNLRKNYLAKVIEDESERDYSVGVVPFENSVGAVDLGMADVPVFDQGAYGTCVTFATTSAMNALLQKGDFISQQCTLQLNRILGQDLWNGAYFSSQIIDPLKKYGIVKQGQGSEKEGKCNSDYPNIFGMITVSGYKNRAKNSGADASKIQYKYYSMIKLNDVKKSLDKHHRVTVGFGILAGQDPISVQGFNLKIKNQETSGGLWACQQSSSESTYCGRPNSGHEVVIIGYDDSQQLLKVRNSWSDASGDNGDFYMTYTFFKAMIFDGTEIY